MNIESSAAPPFTVIRARASSFFLAITPGCAALAALSYFRTWTVFEMGGQVSGTIQLTGFALTRELRGPIPWQLIIAGLLLVILAVSSFMFLTRAAKAKALYCVLLAGLGAFAGLWPMAGVARVSRSLLRLQIIGVTSMTFTAWWWVYCVSVLVIIVSGAVQLLARREESRGL